jgi:FKBP-type peptidyl-prolyl cis-trans isomerase 2
MVLQKKDFIEIEFTGKIKDGEVFDSNIKKNLENLNPDANPKPLIFCLGEGMFLKGVDDFLIGKEEGKYTIELSPEKAFGPRIKELVQMVPIKIFQSQRLNPVPGAVFNFDGRIAKVLSVSSGRVMVDFNNPLAGKIVIYEINVLRKIEDKNEKVKSFIDFLFRREMKFSIEESKVIIEVEKDFVQLVEMFKEKFKDVLDLDLEIKQKAEPLVNSSDSQIKEIENPQKQEQ